MAVTIVDSATSLLALLDRLENLPTQPPSLYLDLEGIRLSRDGSISILQIYLLPCSHSFLVDVHVLQADAFRISNGSGTTLKSVLESKSVPKVFFDVRNDADALFAHYQVSLGGVDDIQLWEVATRAGPQKLLRGLAKCIESDTQLSDDAKKAWGAAKKCGHTLFLPENGGSYEVFNLRPMRQDIIAYCVNDIIYLPILWTIYSRKISKEWASKVQEETDTRVIMSQSISYDPHSKNKGLSPRARVEKSAKQNYFKNRERTATTDRKQKNMSAAEISAMKAAERMAAKQPKATVGLLSSSAKAKVPQLLDIQGNSKAKTPMRNVKAISEYPSSVIGLPVRSKAELQQDGPGREDSMILPAGASNIWICTSCHREMQAGQQQDHLLGKAHIANLVHARGAKSKDPVIAATSKEQYPRASVENPKFAPKAKAKPKTRSQCTPNSGQAKTSLKVSRNISSKASTSQQAGFAHPDQGFVGFIGSSRSCSFYYEDSISYMGDYDQNYGACDNDCGWCGHCMDGFDI
ncbi:hypothetical protein MMC26_001047 [Xylographa opegraphella]|nr:hypothetical protein [Xylographa opegraphella]